MKTTQQPGSGDPTIKEFKQLRLNGASLPEIAQKLGLPLKLVRSMDTFDSPDFAVQSRDNALRELINQNHEFQASIAELKQHKQKFETLIQTALGAGDATQFSRHFRTSTLIQKEIDRIQKQLIQNHLKLAKLFEQNAEAKHPVRWAEDEAYENYLDQNPTNFHSNPGHIPDPETGEGLTHAPTTFLQTQLTKIKEALAA